MIHMRYRPQVDYDALKAGVDLLALVRDTTTDLKRESVEAGGSWAGPCPSCGGRDRLVIRPHGRDGKGPSWWCRKCNPKGGSALDWVMWRQSLDLHEAAAWLARWSGADLGVLPPADLAAHRAEVDAKRAESEAREAKHREAARQHLSAVYQEREYRRALEAHAEVIDALVADGISEYAQERFGFGFATWSGRPALTIPWYRRKGELEAVQYRLLDATDGDKYRWSKGTSGTLWNGEAVYSRSEDWLLCVEGAKKAATCWTAGITSVVAVPNNTSAARILGAADLSAFDRVFVLLDPDSTGEARKAADGLQNGRVIMLPDKVDDWLVARGGDGFVLRARLTGGRVI